MSKKTIKKISAASYAALALFIIAAVFVGRFFVPGVTAADGSGTMSVNPTDAQVSSTGNTFTFTYTAGETMDSGGMRLTVPAGGWSAPQGTPGTAGYTTVSSQGLTANVRDNLDSISGWNQSTGCDNGISLDTSEKLEGTGSFRCDNGNQSNGDRFYKTFPSENWSSYTTIAFWLRVEGGVTNDRLLFAYDNGATLSSPLQQISVGDIPSDTWTYVTLSLSGTRNDVESYGFYFDTGFFLDNDSIWVDEILLGPGSPTFPGSDSVDVRFIDLNGGQTTTVTYGSGGGTSGVTAPATPGDYTFSTYSKISAGGTLSIIGSSPVITLNDPQVTAEFVLNDPGDTFTGTRIGYTVSRENSMGGAVTAGPQTVYLYTNSPGPANFYDASSGGNQITQITIPDGQSSTQFWYSDSSSGTWTVTASDNSSSPDGATGIDDDTDSITITVSQVVESFVLDNPGNMTAGTRIGYTVSRENNVGSLVTSGSSIIYLYSNSSGPKNFYNASSGGSQITSVTIPDGQSNAQFWYEDSAIGTWTVTASDNSSSPDGATGIDDDTDNVTVSAAPIVATRFLITDISPSFSLTGGSVTVTVKAVDNSGNVETTFNDDVTLFASGSATGGGLIDIVSGVGTATISNDVTEIVNLSLSDTEGTGLDTSSTASVSFISTSGDLPPPITTPATVRFSGRAFPDALISVVAYLPDGTKATIKQDFVVASDGFFNIYFSETTYGSYSYVLSARSKGGQAVQTQIFNLSVGPADEGVFVEDIIFPPTINLLRSVVRSGEQLVVSGYSVPESEIKAEIDGKELSERTTSDDKGYYKLALPTINLGLGRHEVKVKQTAPGGFSSPFSPSLRFNVSDLFVTGTDLNADGVIDISDWSIFLFRWSSPEEKPTLDMNGDGKVDISDFSVFIRTVKIKR